MPIVISRKARKNFYYEHEERLAEVMGHSDFAGEDWAVGDLVVFEDGRSANFIRSEDLYNDWSRESAITLEDALNEFCAFDGDFLNRHPSIVSWEQFFSAVKDEAPIPFQPTFYTDMQAALMIAAFFGAIGLLFYLLGLAF